MNRRESVYFVIGIALTAVLFTFVLNGSSTWVSMAQSSIKPTWTFTPIVVPPSTPTPTPIPPTPIPPTFTPTPIPPTATPTPLPPTPTPVPPTPTPSNAPPIVSVDHPLVTVDEGSLAVNGGSAVDPDGLVVGLAASVGSLSGDASAWSWEYVAPDGPASRLVTILAVDDSGELGVGTFRLDVSNVSPDVGALQAPTSPVRVDEQPVLVTVFFTDTLDLHIAAVDWGDQGPLCITGVDADCTLDEGTGGVGSVTASHTYAEAGIYSIRLSVTDDDGGTGTSTAGPVVVYDPTGGFATGGGWIDSPPGAVAADPSLAAKATFGFVSKYKKGAQVPEGNTRFQFKMADLKFESASYDWLVITGSNYARFKGSGTINGNPAPNGQDYKFMLWAGEGRGSNGEDTFRIKIWREDTGHVVYDNGMNQAIGGGQIKVHKGG